MGELTFSTFSNLFIRNTYSSVTFIMVGGDVHIGDTWPLVLGGSETDVVLRGCSVLVPPQLVSPFINRADKPCLPTSLNHRCGKGAPSVFLFLCSSSSGAWS